MKSKWKTTTPDTFMPQVLVTLALKVAGKKTRYVTIGWADRKDNTDDPHGWLSPYRGDDHPAVDGWYLVSMERRRTVTQLWYETKKQSWLAVPDRGDVVAWMPLPAPYRG